MDPTLAECRLFYILYKAVAYPHKNYQSEPFKPVARQKRLILSAFCKITGIFPLSLSV